MHDGDSCGIHASGARFDKVREGPGRRWGREGAGGGGGWGGGSRGGRQRALPGLPLTLLPSTRPPLPHPSPLTRPPLPHPLPAHPSLTPYPPTHCTPPPPPPPLPPKVDKIERIQLPVY
jgi:hypothetical protein